MKNRLTSIILLGTWLLFYSQKAILSQDKALETENLKEISNFQIKINKAKCKFGLREDQLYPTVYSYLKNHNFPLSQNSDSIADANININIKCLKYSEFISLFFDVEIIQAAKINNLEIQAITYNDILSRTAYPEYFNQIEQEGIIKIIDDLINNYKLPSE